MILGTITIFQCDGAGCETTKVVPVELEPQFEAEWHAGLTRHFCPTCRNHVRNQAAIVDDDNAADRFRQEVLNRAA